MKKKNRILAVTVFLYNFVVGILLMLSWNFSRDCHMFGEYTIGCNLSPLFFLFGVCMILAEIIPVVGFNKEALK